VFWYFMVAIALVSKVKKMLLLCEKKLQLSLEDRNTVSNGRQLNSKHVNFSQMILKEKFLRFIVNIVVK